MPVREDDVGLLVLDQIERLGDAAQPFPQGLIAAIGEKLDKPKGATVIDAGGDMRLVQEIGAGWTKLLAMTGRRIDAQTAARIGIEGQPMQLFVHDGQAVVYSSTGYETGRKRRPSPGPIAADREAQ